MAFSNVVAFCILLATAATLNAGGVTDIQTSAQAAEALRPLAGAFTFLLFALGIIGTGLIAVPVLAGSAAYAVTEKLRMAAWARSEAARGAGVLRDHRARHARRRGARLLSDRPDPGAVLKRGVIAVPIMVVMMLLADDRKVMGGFTVTRRLKALGWLATGTMAAAVAAMFAT